MLIYYNTYEQYFNDPSASRQDKINALRKQIQERNEDIGVLRTEVAALEDVLYELMSEEGQNDHR